MRVFTVEVSCRRIAVVEAQPIGQEFPDGRDQPSSPTHDRRTALTTAHAAGLRAAEAVRLKVSNIDSCRMDIRVEHGKGGKGRYVMLSVQLLGIPRVYWRPAQPVDWLFRGRGPRQPVNVQVLYSACRSAATAAGLGKPVTVHTLRHGSLPIFWRMAPASMASTSSSKVHSQSVKPASIAGVTRKVWWMRTQLYQTVQTATM